LANRVEEFTLRFLDPLKYDPEEREVFFDNSETDRILEHEIKLEQKKVKVRTLNKYVSLTGPYRTLTKYVSKNKIICFWVTSLSAV